MKLSLIFLIVLVTLPVAQALSITSRIHKIKYGEGPGHPHLLLLENGRVAMVNTEEKSLLIDLEDAREQGALLEIEVDDRHHVISMASAEEKTLGDHDENSFLLSPANFEPTNLSSTSEAQTIFKRMNARHQRDSQCYNRAHIWAYEEWKQSGLQSMKLFMFFTKRYIWDYNYGWWFHVSPLTYVKGGPVVLDRTFTRGPTSIKNWTLSFIRSRRDCPMVSKYSQYENNQQTEHCYLIPATMYFWQPRDLEAYERRGTEKKAFIRSEINHAYWEAF